MSEVTVIVLGKILGKADGLDEIDSHHDMFYDFEIDPQARDFFHAISEQTKYQKGTVKDISINYETGLITLYYPSVGEDAEEGAEVQLEIKEPPYEILFAKTAEDETQS